MCTCTILQIQGMLCYQPHNNTEMLETSPHGCRKHLPIFVINLGQSVQELLTVETYYEKNQRVLTGKTLLYLIAAQLTILLFGESLLVYHILKLFVKEGYPRY